MKQIEVQIMGQSYLLGCPEGGEPQLREAVERVDAAMCKIRDAGKVKARDRIAVLASLNLAFDLAQREASLASFQAAPPAPVAAPMPVPASNAGDEADDARAAHLLQRLDQALAGDGHLL
ncbi:cell division protein ZapA [Variovorax sp. KK3]|uniref:cell division protein ZapA n=1 Tax=Variovorax sp. KK3 TaxID=1855728 RepID=UPI00097BBFD2|nr:cell division protein ZapA [Variovorax sp. KK3]